MTVLTRASDCTNPRHVEINELRQFAYSLQTIACQITGARNQQVAYDLIRKDRPYCVWRDNTNVWYVKNRGYSTVLSIPLTDDDIRQIGFADWHRSAACKYANDPYNWPIIEDAFNVRYLPAAASLILLIADCAEAKQSGEQQQ